MTAGISTQVQAQPLSFGFDPLITEGIAIGDNPEVKTLEE